MKEECKMNVAKAKEVFSDEALVTSLLKLDTPEEVQTALKAKGLELSLGDINAVREGLIKAAENNGELNEADLEKVAGGWVPWIAVGIVLAGVGGAALGAVGVDNLTRRRW
jgi:lactobin A/cerein 7B family class IIb bacteriocin